MAAGVHNIIDYVREQMDPFSVRPLCRVDSLVLSQLSYARLPVGGRSGWGMEGMPLKELWRADWIEEMTGRMYDPQGAAQLICALAASPRFREILLCDYMAQIDPQSDMQFSAMTFRISPEDTYVAFRGTDNTLVGWKEGFNMAFAAQVPAQRQSVRYLERAASRTAGRIWVGGHSKGGNLSVYAALACAPEVRDRLVCCFSHDGPGFTSSMRTELDVDEDAIEVDRTVPQSSVFGMLYDNPGKDVMVVRSASGGFSQHDPLSWEVEGCDFVEADGMTVSASYLDSSLNSWIAQASPEERKDFIDALFQVIEAGGEPYFHDLKIKWRSTFPQMAHAALSELEPEERSVLLRQFANLVKSIMPGGE